MTKHKKRTEGRYLIRVPIGKNEDGKTVYKQVTAKPLPELEIAIAATMYDSRRFFHGKI